MDCRILVVDDDDDVCFTIKYVLERAAYCVLVAGSADQALRAFVEFKPELVITDLIMPGESGIDLIRKLKKVAPQVKVVAISGGERVTDRTILEDALRVGASRALQKPFRHAELMQIVVNLLNSSRG